MSALRLLCESKKSTDIILLSNLPLISCCVQLHMNSQSPAFRNQTISTFKKVYYSTCIMELLFYLTCTSANILVFCCLLLTVVVVVYCCCCLLLLFISSYCVESVTVHIIIFIPQIRRNTRQYLC